MILRKIAHCNVVSPRDRAAVNRELLLLVANESGSIAHERFQKCCLARSVAAHQRYFFSARHARAEWRKHFRAVVGLHHALNFEWMFSGVLIHLKTDERPGNV